MPLQATSGAASYDAFGGGVAAVPNYIESCFSTYLYTGNGSTQTITNGIDLSTKGGLVWSKSRSTADNNVLLDTVRGANSILVSNTTAAASISGTPYVTATTTGYSIGTSNSQINGSGNNYASWTFRKQPKFFDILTWTGDGTAGRAISHNLGSAPGAVFIKCTSNARNWRVWHRSLTTAQSMVLNSTAIVGSTDILNSTAPTSTTLTISADPDVNNSGYTYVAYLFAHNAGGFGLTGADNVISCGSFTANGSGNATVNLGYEPQWLLLKRTDSATGGGWIVADSMRGSLIASLSNEAAIFANDAQAEAANGTLRSIASTGFSVASATASSTYIYIAIRRGPMKVPTSGTSVFEPVTSTSANFVKGTLEASDMGWFKDRATVANWFVGDRLRGIMSYYNPTLYTNLTDAEATPTTGDTVTSTSSEGTGNGKIYFGGAGATTDQPLGYSFKRAPSFMDVVCYTGTGSTIALNHNLAAVPELMIVKSRGAATGNWVTYTATYGSGSFIRINSTSGNNTGAGNLWGATTPTSSLFYVGEGGAGGLSVSANNYVAYLFATCAGVSKVGSYTGTGTTKQVDCGFTGGARFVLIKRTDSSGDWYVWDSARGIVAGNDPYLLLNSTAAEVTNTDYVDTYSAGFEISSTAPAAINASGGTFIFLAIA